MVKKTKRSRLKKYRRSKRSRRTKSLTGGNGEITAHAIQEFPNAVEPENQEISSLRAISVQTSQDPLEQYLFDHGVPSYIIDYLDNYTTNREITPDFHAWVAYAYFLRDQYYNIDNSANSARRIADLNNLATNTDVDYNSPYYVRVPLIMREINPE